MSNIWFAHEGGYDLVEFRSDIPEYATGYYVECDGVIIEANGSCEELLGQIENEIFSE